jgi:mono/diheme cytochrome c family protein
MLLRTTLLALAILASHAGVSAQTVELRSPSDFASIADRADRSKALFTEAGKVIQHPRCINCHPVGERPLQGEQMQLHQPLVVRGPDDKGAVALRCSTCHGVANYEPAGVPGHPLWHVAPRSLAWQGLSLGQICSQLKDRRRNGNKSLAQIHEHMAKDTLVGWGWTPGGKRAPAPGTQERFGELIGAWIDTGADCPA